jgi:hypothetical protein
LIVLDDEYKKVAAEFKKVFGYGVPLSMIPPVETNENLIKNLKKCIEQKKDLLAEIYNWDYSKGKLY